MKKRNLFLSLVCSIILTIALVAVTIASVIVPNNANNPNGNTGSNVSDRPSPEQPVDPKPEDPNYPNNDDNDGSEEKPYVIYNAESFIDLLKAHGTEGKFFTLDRDIDFAGTEYVTLFQDEAFNGHINGNEKSIKNISINVNKEVSEKFMTKEGKTNYVSNVAVFGKLNGAVIENITFDNITINIAEDYINFVKSNEFNATYKGYAFKQLSVATVAAIADNSTIKANVVNSTINGGAYSVYAEDHVQGYNAIGGVVAVANKVEISNSNISVKMNVASGKNYFVGGVTGYAYNSTISDVNADIEVSAKYNQVLYVGGVAGYILNTNLNNIEVNLSAKEADENNRFSSTGVKLIADEDFTTVAGIVNVIRANDETQVSTITNVKVNSNVDMDTVFAGAIMEVRSTAEVTERFVTIKDVIVNSNVNTLKAYGFAKYLICANVSLTEKAYDEEAELEYSVRLTGNVKLNSNDKMVTAAIFTYNMINDSNDNLVYLNQEFTVYQDADQTIKGGFEDIKVVVSTSIIEQVTSTDSQRPFGNR